ncbi:MAG: SRPBCC family protein [Acidimicrobiia bacterium]
MVHKTEITAVAHSPASAGELWELLADVRTWPSWSAFDEGGLLEEAPGGGDGLGALRRLRSGRNVSIERVVAHEAPRHLGYALVEGLPLRDYRADVTLEPMADGRTRITWRSTFRGKVPGTAWFYKLVLGVFIKRLTRALAAAPVTARSSSTA